jgi:MFS-type transporter involved in bile tolerance (Atg22 family)
MPSVLTVFAICVFVAAIITVVVVMFRPKSDDNYFTIASLSIHVAVFVAASTFGNSLIFNFAVDLGRINFKGTYGDATDNIWGSALIIGIMAFTAITMMFLKNKIDLKKTP